MNLSITLHGSLRKLPLVLCGPILRRVTRDSVTVWVALHSNPVKLTLYVKNTDKTTRFWGPSDGGILQIGEHLYLCCVTTKTQDSDQYLDPGKLYYYDIEFGDGVTLNSPNVLRSDDFPSVSLAYAGTDLPGFVFPPDDLTDLKIVHGSCRKPHGANADAMPCLDKLIEDKHDQPAQRPQILCLTGDQIYADDVSDEMLGLIAEVGTKILGYSTTPIKFRQDFSDKACSFTSTAAANHLASFGEFFAMYLLVWSDILWPADLSKSPPWLKGFYKGLPAVRRAFANIATYMILDDHEITDDWFISRAWYEQTSRIAAQNVMANGLLAYALFQGWGNLGTEEAKKREPFRTLLTQLNFGTVDKNQMATIRKAMLPVKKLDGTGPWDYLSYGENQTPWSFRIEYPHFQLQFLDTRTLRAYQGKSSTPALIAAKNLLTQLAGIVKKDLTVIISPTPIFGIELIEYFLSADRKKIFENDQEGWSYNTQGYYDIQQALLFLGKVVILSGDVHYGFSNRVVYWDEANNKSAIFFQCCSSALKNPPEMVHAIGLRVGELTQEGGVKKIWAKRDGSLYLMNPEQKKSGDVVQYQFRSTYQAYFNPSATKEKLKPLTENTLFEPFEVYTNIKKQLIVENHLGLVRFDKNGADVATHEFYTPAAPSPANYRLLASHFAALTLSADDHKPIEP